MPLRQAPYHEPILDESIFFIRLPMLDDQGHLVWVEITDYALRQRAMLDGFNPGVGKVALFERYRLQIEQRAGELYDQGKAIARSDGTRFVQVPTGVL